MVGESLLVVPTFSLFAADDEEDATAAADAQTSTVTDKTTTMRIIDDELDDDDNVAVIWRHNLEHSIDIFILIKIPLESF